MTEERNAKVSAAYRELGSDEPSRALDDAILAAARRSRSSWRGRWAVPLSLAAVVVLSVTVTLRIQREQPEIAALAPAVQIPAKPAADIVAKAAPERLKPKAEVLAPAASASGAVTGPAAERDLRADQAYARARPPAAAGAMAERAEAPARVLAETPERELERIAGLRGMGRHDEAERALAEFRKRYPEFRISEEMRARVERR